MSTELAVASITPMELLQNATQSGASIEQLKELMALQERWEANEAKKAFNIAMTNFKSTYIRIRKDKLNKQYDSHYVSLGNLVATVTPYLSQNNLSARWDVDQSSGIRVTCIVTHSMGHSESVSMTAPPDTSGAKNPIQQIKSTITYARACTFEAICGLASSEEANLDDDGNGAGQGLGDQEFAGYLEDIEGAANEGELKVAFAKAFKAAAKDKAAKEQFIKAKDARKAELA